MVDALISVSNLMMFSSCFEFFKEVEYEERIDYSDFVGGFAYGGKEILGCSTIAAHCYVQDE